MTNIFGYTCIGIGALFKKIAGALTRKGRLLEEER